VHDDEKRIKLTLRSLQGGKIILGEGFTNYGPIDNYLRNIQELTNSLAIMDN
jgi:hypothetical protein